MSMVSTPPSTTLSTPSPTERNTAAPFDDPDDEAVQDEAAMLSIIKTTTTIIRPVTVHAKPVYVIVATSLRPSMGIGYQNKLPWPALKADMAFFRNVTSRVGVAGAAYAAAAATKMFNAVVMGRKTWDSIPLKFRPLAGRLNVIITRTDAAAFGRRLLEELNAGPRDRGNQWAVQPLTISLPSSTSTPAAQSPNGLLLTPPSFTPAPILIASSLRATLALLSRPSPIPLVNPTTPTATAAMDIQKIFCIGGAEIYRKVISLSSTQGETPIALPVDGEVDTDGEGDGEYNVRILQTQVRRQAQPAADAEPDFECDTFFPDALPTDSAIKSARWRLVSPVKLREWCGGVDLPQDQAQAQPTAGTADAQTAWARDDKLGLEIRVVGWERR